MSKDERIIGYKSVRVDGTSWYDGKFGPWEVGAMLSVEGAVRGGACGHGIHVGKTIANAVQYGKFPFRLWRVEGVGQVLGEDETKWRFGSVRILKKVPLPQWAQESETFVASIAEVPWFKPTEPPRKTWRHYETRDAAGVAARDAARDAAGAAAWAAARAAARAAAGDAAGAAAGVAARAAAWDAARAKYSKALRSKFNKLMFKEGKP